MYPEGKSPMKEVVGLWHWTGWVAYEICAPGRGFYCLSDLANCGVWACQAPNVQQGCTGSKHQNRENKRHG